MIKKIEFRASIPPIMSAIRTGGDGLRLTLDIPELDVPDSVALIALRKCALKITVEVDNETTATKKGKREKKEKEPKGPHGQYWHEMFRREVFDRLELKDVLDVPDGDVGVTKQALKNRFGVSSLTFIEPGKFEHWAEGKGLHSVVSDSRLAQQELLTKAGE